MVTNPYAAGSTIYGSGSSAATSGTVDPMGYIERELEKRRLAYQGGADGQSDTRSGIAAQALAANPTSQAAAAPPQVDTAALTQQFYSLIGAGPDGSLQYPQLNLPFDLDIANERASEVANYNQQNQMAIQALQQAAQNRLMNIRQIDEAEPTLHRGNLNQHAARGMAYSSGYGQSTSDIAREILGQRNQVEMDWQGNQQNVANMGINNRLSLLQRLNQLASTQSERAAANAPGLALASEQAALAARPDAGQNRATITKPSSGSGVATTRAQFLKNNPAFAKMTTAQRQTWLKNHPDAARVWARVN
jgi:hypothetical protein